MRILLGFMVAAIFLPASAQSTEVGPAPDRQATTRPLPIPLTTAASAGIPLAEPKVITAPGRYVVIRNINHPGNVIEIESSDVTLDLNGFTLRNTTDSGSAIQVSPIQKENVTITNGIVRGGDTCIWVDRTDGLEVSGIQADGCRIGLFLDDNKLATITDNRVQADSIGIDSDNCASCRISDNLLRSGGGAAEAGILFGFGVAADISGNRVTAFITGIRAEGKGLEIRDNVVADCSDALVVKTINSHIAGNVLSTNGTGLTFDSVSKDNVYRGNTARGNGIAFVDDGANNTSAGDNFLPGKM